MKLLAVSSLSDAPGWRKDNTTSPVDMWRIVNMYKNSGLDVDFTKTFIPNFEKYRGAKDFSLDQVEGETTEYFKNYDIIVSSYFREGLYYAMMRVLCEKTDTTFVLDVDDDFWSVPEDNPIWLTLDDNKMAVIRWMISDAEFITTSTEHLAEVYRKHRTGKSTKSVIVLPNMISLKNYAHKPYDNGDKVIIGWFGGSSHYNDFNKTGVTQALARLMHKYKNVELHVCDVEIEEYLPRARVKHIKPKRGLQWLELYKSFQFDIGLAPLMNTEFAMSKSNIKWQEYACMGATFCGSEVGPYKETVYHNKTGLLCKNNEVDWYNNLEKLILNKSLRKTLSKNAFQEVKKDYSIENNSHRVEDAIKTIYRLRNNHLQPA